MNEPQPKPDSHSDPDRCAIWVCPNGCVCMQFGVAMVHLPRDLFFQFMLAARELMEAMHLNAEHADGCPGAGQPN